MEMRTQLELLNDLVNLNGDIDELMNVLSNFYNNIIETLIYLKRQNVNNALKRAKENSISFQSLESWAIELRQREDVEFQDEQVHEIMSELANPDLFGYMIYERLQNLK